MVWTFRRTALPVDEAVQVTDLLAGTTFVTAAPELEAHRVYRIAANVGTP